MTYLLAFPTLWGSNSVMAQVPKDAYADGMVEDGPIAIESICGAPTYVPTKKNFHLK